MRCNVAIDGLTCKTAVHICYGYGIQANIDWKRPSATNGASTSGFFPFWRARRRDRSDFAGVPQREGGADCEVDGLAARQGRLGTILSTYSRRIAETHMDIAATITAAMQFVPPDRPFPRTTRHGADAPGHRGGETFRSRARYRAGPATAENVTEPSLWPNRPAADPRR